MFVEALSGGIKVLSSEAFDFKGRVSVSW